MIVCYLFGNYHRIGSLNDSCFRGFVKKLCSLDKEMHNFPARSDFSFCFFILCKD